MCRTYEITYRGCDHVDSFGGMRCESWKNCTPEVAGTAKRYGVCTQCTQDETLIYRTSRNRLDGRDMHRPCASFYFENVIEFLFDPVLARRDGNGMDAFKASIGSPQNAQALLSIYYMVECEYQFRCEEKEHFDRVKMRRFLAQLMSAINQYFMAEAESSRCDRKRWFHRLARPDMRIISLPDDDNERRCSICFENFVPSQGDLPSKQDQNRNDNQNDSQEDNQDEIQDQIQDHNQESNDLELPYRTACGHVFGKRCLNKWLEENGDWRGARCPICRLKFPSILEIDMIIQNGTTEALWLQGLMREGAQLEYLQNRRK